MGLALGLSTWLLFLFYKIFRLDRNAIERLPRILCDVPDLVRYCPGFPNDYRETCGSTVGTESCDLVD